MSDRPGPGDSVDTVVEESIVTEKAAISVGPESIPGVRRACLLVLAGRDAGRIVPLETRETLIGRSAAAHLRLSDHGISRKHALILRRGDDWVAQDLGSSNGTLVNGDVVEEMVLRDGDRIQLGPGTVLKFTFHDAADEEFQKNLLAAAQRDGLTRTYNRRYLMEWLAAEAAYAKRSKKSLSVLMLDLDHFKHINDQHGHPAGDAVLTRFADVVSGALRKEDVLARYGGEEFVVVCRGETEDGARQLAERLRKLIESSLFQADQRRFSVTASIGIAGLTQEISSAEDLIAASDAALYAAKNKGRNCVVAFSDVETPLLEQGVTERVPKRSRSR